MSGQSSSGSWSGRGAGADIIDLDKFMRGAVRPSEPLHRRHQEHYNRLVVDGGGPARKLGRSPSSTNGSASGASSKCAIQSHAKRFSHDSGLSDGTYKRRRHRPHRRPSGAEGAGVRREPTSARTLRGSSNSLRAFRAVCERALLDQQQQIARVAQLCERLTERRTDCDRDAKPHPAPTLAPEPATADTTDISSSSRSTADQRRKDKHRAEECKTYKIIMNRLDELNRLFAARAKQASTTAPAAPSAPVRHPPAPSSASVSISDKLVATEPELKRKIITPSKQAGARARARAGGRSVTQSCVVDIAPTEARPALLAHHPPNVLTQRYSIIKCESSVEESGSSKCDPRCGFDLENPLHLYTQAKRLQAMHATSHRARSSDQHERSERHERHERQKEMSLCALCRGYWRSLRQYLAAQIFCRPDIA